MNFFNLFCEIYFLIKSNSKNQQNKKSNINLKKVLGYNKKYKYYNKVLFCKR